MTWTTPDELKAHLRRLWDRGELLRTLIDGGGGTAFPLRLTLKTPGSTELVDRFETVRAWIAGLSAMPHLRIEWREVQHRVLGRQRLPQAVWIDRLDDALALLGRRREAHRFTVLLEQTREQQPDLLPWLVRRPQQALDQADDWYHLLAVVDWVRRHPRPGMYLRQVDLPGVHSKFIEAHRGVLGELLDLVLPPSAVASMHTGVAQFAARYGFLDKPLRLRLRVLDARLALLPGATQPDVTLDADSFARLDLAVRHVFITENEVNFLAFPPVADAIVLFGAGYGWEALARAAWLTDPGIRLHYWGDIDTHGFAILDQLRRTLPPTTQVHSLLMDHATLMAHQTLWTQESEPARHDLNTLTEPERVLFDALRDGRLGAGVRLEQERVGYAWLMNALRITVSAPADSSASPPARCAPPPAPPAAPAAGAP